MYPVDLISASGTPIGKRSGRPASSSHPFVEAYPGASSCVHMRELLELLTHACRRFLRCEGLTAVVAVVGNCVFPVRFDAEDSGSATRSLFVQNPRRNPYTP